MTGLWGAASQDEHAWILRRFDQRPQQLEVTLARPLEGGGLEIQVRFGKKAQAFNHLHVIEEKAYRISVAYRGHDLLDDELQLVPGIAFVLTRRHVLVRAPSALVTGLCATAVINLTAAPLEDGLEAGYRVRQYIDLVGA